MTRKLFRLLAVLLGMGISALAAEPVLITTNVMSRDPLPVSDLAPAATNAPSGPPVSAMKEIAPGLFQLGGVTLNTSNKTVRFRARVDLVDGTMEYFVVSTWGKTYESICSTETDPRDIHVAMLLLGAKGAGTNLDAALENSESIVSHPAAVRLPGDPVSIDLKWTAKGKEIRRPIADLVENIKSKRALKAGSWVYNGSFMIENTFLAEREGSIISLVTDPQALINNMAPGHDDDSLWRPNRRNLPPTNTVVEVTIGLEKR
jgi:hypothetical protein